MILVSKSSVSSVLDLLEILLQLHLSVKQSVLVNVLLILDFLMIGKLGKNALMLFLQLSYTLTVLFLSLSLLQLAALSYRLIVLFVEVSLDISLCLRNQLGNLSLVLGLNLFRLLQVSLCLRNLSSLLFFC